MKHDALRTPAIVPLRPARVSLPSEKVTLVDPTVSPIHGPQPTIQDALNAIQDLSKKISQLSKNQQTLADNISNVESIVACNYSNIVNGACWVATWVQTIYNWTVTTPGPDSSLYQPPTPHWSHTSKVP